jgi:hypothetical protein
MPSFFFPVSRRLAPVFLTVFCSIAALAGATSDSWQDRHDQLVARLRAVQGKEAGFGPAYQPLFHAAMPWYEQWGGRNRAAVDNWMVSPEDFAGELAGALEHDRNFFAANPGALFPLVFEGKLPDGSAAKVDYWIKLPAGFPAAGRTFPLLVNLHGSGWLGHKISFVRGTKAAGLFFEVTPIDEAGPWSIDFLNAFLDRLMEMLPIDRDRVYAQGHSLGGMATWEWALDNPERFAAISPHSGIGEPYRAVRLKYIPSWVIHGANDDVVPTGNADQMVSALQSVGASVTYSVLKGGQHNMPDDFDDQPVLEWYLRQVRSHVSPPADPRDALGIDASGSSPWKIISLPARQAWKTGPLKPDQVRQADHSLFDHVHARGEIVDSPVRFETDLKTGAVTLWLARPRELRSTKDADPSLVTLPAGKFLRFYFRGETAKALEHLQAIAPAIVASGHSLADKVWITPLSLWRETPGYLAEYWVETR